MLLRNRPDPWDVNTGYKKEIHWHGVQPYSSVSGPGLGGFRFTI